MKKGKLLRCISVVLLLVTFLLSTGITAFAATASQYGWYWNNSNVDRKTFGLTESAFKKIDFYLDNEADYKDSDIDRVSSPMLSYYTKVSGKSTQESWVFYKGANVYNMEGKRVRSDTKGESADYIGYDKNGVLYVITSSNKLLSSKNNGTTWTTLLSSGATKLLRDDNDLSIKVSTSSGTKTLESLTGSTPSEPARNRVETYMTSGGHVIFDAYKDGKVYVTVTNDNNYVYVAGYTLLENCAGAKFIGIDEEYSVYLADTNGRIYKYYYNKWTTPYSTKPSGDLLDYLEDDDGFLKEIETSNQTYKVSNLSFSRYY